MKSKDNKTGVAHLKELLKQKDHALKVALKLQARVYEIQIHSLSERIDAISKRFNVVIGGVIVLTVSIIVAILTFKK